MDDDRGFDAKVRYLSEEGPYDCSDPATALEAVGDSLEAWNDLLRESPEYLSNLILKDSGREMLHLSIAAMRACLSQVAEVVRARAEE